MELLDLNINESAKNSTRIRVFSRPKNCKLSTYEGKFMLMFTVKNDASALVQALNVPASYSYNRARAALASNEARSALLSILKHRG